MQVKHYTYSTPYLLPSGVLVQEEYELWDHDHFMGIYYTNPAPSQPIQHIRV